MAKLEISIVDDDKSVREAMAGLMRSIGFSANVFSSGESFLKSDSLRRTACLIADVHMPGMTGLELHHRLVASGDPVPTILITAHVDDKVRADALDAGVVAYLAKPVDETQLLSSINSALGRRKQNETQS